MGNLRPVCLATFIPKLIPLLQSGTHTTSRRAKGVVLYANTVSDPDVDAGTADESGRELGYRTARALSMSASASVRTSA